MTFMYLPKEGIIFSLTEVSGTAPGRDTTKLFEELFAFLFLAGLFQEGEGEKGVVASAFTTMPISDKNFHIPAGSYNWKLAELITTGLKNRFHALTNCYDLNPQERSVLTFVNRLFVDDKSWTKDLTGSELYGIAIGRSFSNPFASLARYVAMMFGRSDFPEATEVPVITISALGDIYLTTETTLILEKPELPYGSRLDDGTTVTALWSLLSCQLSAFSKDVAPGDKLGEALAGMIFLSQPCEFAGSIPAPLYAAALYMQRLLGIDTHKPVAISAAFYQSFLYGSTDKRTVSRKSILNYLLDLMVKKTGQADFELFGPNSYNWKLRSTSTISNKTPKRPALLEFALEALDPVKEDSEDVTTSDTSDTDPQTEDGGFDPTAPSPVTMESEEDGGFDPTTTPEPTQEEVASASMNTIGLISFDKSGEGVDEELYRSAVIALNDTLRNDDTLPVAAEVREALDYWVNGFLYRTAISSTKDLLVALNLQKQLKKFKHK